MQNPTRSQQMLLFTALYTAQGLPYGFFTLALPVLMREAGLSLIAISATSLLYLPWLLKFLWAPCLDHCATPRRWLLTLQISGVISALALACTDLESNLLPIVIGAFVFNIVAASQDVVTDGLAVRTLNTSELGFGNGIQVGAYRFGMILGGGVLLKVFDLANWSTVFLCMAVMLALTVLPVLRIDPALPAASKDVPSMRALTVLWLRRLMMPGMLAMIGLIFCYRLGDAMISNLLTPFMVDKGLTKGDIALLKGTIGSATSLLGALLGGWFAFRVQRRTLLYVAGLAQAASFAPYVLVANDIGGRELLWLATVSEGLIGTVATVALFTLMMDASDPEHAGTDYTLYASAVVGINGIGTFLGALLGDTLGFAWMFAIAIVLSVLGCLVLVRQLSRRPLTPRIAQAWSQAPAAAG